MSSASARFACLVVGIFLVTPAAQAGDRVSVGGYVKSFVVGFDQADIKWGDLTIKQPFLWANNNRVRGNLGVKLVEWLSFDASYDLSLRIQHDDLFSTNPIVIFPDLGVYRAADLEARIWPENPGEGDHVALLQNLDRFYFTASAPGFDLIVGRQVIAWGSAHAITPTDVLTPFLYTEIDTEDRIGVDAARLRVPAGSLAELDAGYVAGEDFAWDQSAAYVRARFYALRSDMAALAMAFRENVLVGIDIARTVGRAGTWCEAAYVWADAADHRTSGDSDTDYLRLSAGTDYNFSVGTGLYTFLEYHYNGAGVNEPNDYVTNVTKNSAAYVDGSVYFLGRHYLVPGISYQLTALTSVFVEALVNLSDGSFLLSPYVEYSLAENVSISAGGYGAFGENPGILDVTADEPTVILNSEFGTYPQQYYAFLRYYF